MSEKYNIVPSEFIIIGGTGNLSKNKILPALFWRFLDKQIDEQSNIVLCDKEIKFKDNFLFELKSKCDEALSKDLENKAKNRRIEVVLIPKLDELFEIISN